MDVATLSTLEQRTALAEARLAAMEEAVSAGGQRTSADCASATTSMMASPSFHTAAAVSASGGGVSSSTVADLQELHALLLKAKEEQEAMRRERDQVGAPCVCATRFFKGACLPPPGRGCSAPQPHTPLGLIGEHAAADPSPALDLRVEAQNHMVAALPGTPLPQAVKERAAAQKEADKAKYRVLHLARALKEADARAVGGSGAAAS